MISKLEIPIWNILFLFFWSAITIVLIGIITFTHPEISLLNFDFSFRGINLMVRVYQVPFYFFAAGIPIYTLILAYQRMTQTERQLELSNKQLTQAKKQFDLNSKQFQSIKTKEKGDIWIALFFKILDIHKENVKKINYWENQQKLSGIEALDMFVLDLGLPLHDILGDDKLDIDEKFAEYKEAFESKLKELSIRYSLEVYINHVEIMFEHLAKHPISVNGHKFFRIFIAQLAEVELRLLLGVVVNTKKLQILKELPFYFVLFDSLELDPYVEFLLGEFQRIAKPAS